VKTLEERNNQVIPSHLHIVRQSTPINFSSPPNKLKIIVIIGAWQSPIVQPTFLNPTIDNPNVKGEPTTSNPITK
jgi:hypothetical protein